MDQAPIESLLILLYGGALDTLSPRTGFAQASACSDALGDSSTLADFSNACPVASGTAQIPDFGKRLPYDEVRVCVRIEYMALVEPRYTSDR